MWFPFKRRSLTQWNAQTQRRPKGNSLTKTAAEQGRNKGVTESCPFTPPSLPHSITHTFWSMGSVQTLTELGSAGCSRTPSTAPGLLQELGACQNNNHFLPHPAPGSCTFQDSKEKNNSVLEFCNSFLGMCQAVLSSSELRSAGQGEAAVFFKCSLD